VNAGALAADALRGSFTPLVTPFRDGAIDIPAYRRLVELQVEGGSRGIVVNGTSAEPSTLTSEERHLLVRTAVETAAGQLSVVAATGSQSHAETVWLSERAVAAGADALLVVTPYYVKPPQRGLVEYFVDICARFDLPVLLYHIPGRAAVSMTPDTVASIAARADNLVGVKHAVDDLGFVTELLARLGHDFRIFVGLEELSFPELAIGAAGLMNAVGNLAPAKVTAMCDAVASGDLEEGRRLHFELFELNRAVFFDTNPIPIKYMLCKLGVLNVNEHRLPMVPASPELEQRLDGVLERAKLS
jgi:4-hydroxy-tetrahydrodipicolinate synthase